MMEKYKRTLEECRVKLLEIIDDEEGWESCKTSTNIVISRKHSTFFEGHVFKGEMEIDAPFNKVAKAWAPKPKGHRGDWDTQVVCVECVEDLDEEACIVRTETVSTAMGLVAAREFVDLMMLRFEEDGETAMTVSESIKHDKCPLQDRLVRGTNYPGGTLYRKIGANKTHMTFIHNNCLGGSLPTSLVEAIVPKSLYSMLDAFRKVVMKG